MAGDWIKMRSNLWDDPRVARLCDLTGQTEAAVIGGLYWLWAMADQHSVDGVLEGLSLGQVDRKTGIKGFGQALEAVGWLDVEGDSLRIPEFESHNGTSAKKRALTARRVAAHKASGNAADVSVGAVGGESVTPVCQSANAKVTPPALPREREEIEEEVNLLVASPASAGPSTAGAGQFPSCPADRLVELYHEVLPELPRCRVMTDARRRALQRRWRWVLTSKRSDGHRRAASVDDALAWFRLFFDRARASDFLMGRTSRSPGHEGWQCDLDYLLSDKGLKAVVEKTEVAA